MQARCFLFHNRTVVFSAVSAGSFVTGFFGVQVDIDCGSVLIRFNIYMETRIKSSRIQTAGIAYFKILVRILDFNITALAEKILGADLEFLDYKAHDTIIVWKKLF